MIATINIIGRLGGDPESRFTQDGMEIVTVSVAVKRKYRKNRSEEENNKAVWYKVSLWGNRGKYVMDQLSEGKIGKGAMVFAEGPFEPDEWTGNDGSARTTYEVDAQVFRVISYESSDGGRPSVVAQQSYVRQPQRQPVTYDDVPF